MNGDDDLAASLPRPPSPATARREAAVDSALRRFDGSEARPVPGDRRPERAPSWWSGPTRPYAGALAGALLVARVALPWVWTSLDPVVAERVRRPAAEAGRPEPAGTAADPVAADPTLDKPGAEPKAPAAVAEPRPEPMPAPVEPSLEPALEPDAPVPALREAPAADVAPPRAEAEAVVVTGTRLRRPNLDSAVPITSIGGEEFFQTGSLIRRGDWNACTVDDPRRDLRACRKDVASVARGASGKASAHLAEGLAQAWQGELEDSVGAFDRAIAIAPRSSSAYLNRGLARRGLGEAEGALADLDKAIAYAPQSARGYYHRGRLLRQRGYIRRARADEARAIALDPRYAAVVRAGRK